MAKASTALRNKLLDTNPFRTIFNLGFLKIYAGPVPASADDALIGGTHTLLVTISNNGTGTGLTFNASASNGAIAKNTAETWSGVSIAAGVPSFYRLVTPADTGGQSTTEARLQGTIATSGADLNMTLASIPLSTSIPVDAYSVALPTL
jgi:hypothetical protein